MSSVIHAADALDKLRPLQPDNSAVSLRRMQLQFDGMAWTRGRGCTRLLVRCLDLKADFNSPLYARDSVFYIGSDKFKDLSANFRIGGEMCIHEVLLQSMRFSRSHDNRKPLQLKWRCKSRVSLPRLLSADGTVAAGPCQQEQI
eukprot:6179149-Pleurochrysis_carterae.AAC.1